MRASAGKMHLNRRDVLQASLGKNCGRAALRTGSAETARRERSIARDDAGAGPRFAEGCLHRPNRRDQPAFEHETQIRISRASACVERVAGRIRCGKCRCAIVFSIAPAARGQVVLRAGGQEQPGHRRNRHRQKQGCKNPPHANILHPYRTERQIPAEFAAHGGFRPDEPGMNLLPELADPNAAYEVPDGSSRAGRGWCPRIGPLTRRPRIAIELCNQCGCGRTAFGLHPCPF